MDQLETRELGYFLAVADELHFGRAAERLGIAQPPLSRAIARLERRLGVALFERTSRRVELTEAGRAFRVEARKAMRAIERAVHSARGAGGRRLRVAAVPGTGSGRLRELLAAWATRERAPVDLIFTLDQPGALRDGRADVAVVCDTGDLAGLDVVELGREAPVALVPASHPLARRDRVSLAALCREPAFLADCPPVGLDQLIDRVALGLLIVVVGDGVRDRLGDAVVPVPVTDLPATTVVLAWPQDTIDPRTAAFVTMATEMLDADQVAAAS
jgi:DNA-binding transcriptional LysR family regulator